MTQVDLIITAQPHAILRTTIYEELVSDFLTACFCVFLEDTVEVEHCVVIPLARGVVSIEYVCNTISKTFTQEFRGAYDRSILTEFLLFQDSSNISESKWYICRIISIPLLSFGSLNERV